MGIAIDKRDRIDSINIYVSRKNGPKIGYIAHYAYFPYPKSNMPKIKLVRLIGEFSGIKEIESLAVDTLYNRILYSDENDVRYHCVCVEQTPDFAPILFEDVIARIEAEGGSIGFKSGNGPTM